eukprot:Seg11577.1 transcript_id=Seg11577.1/GoldUCD/mRNA.D3Y31 product="hypothetical protein" pseudo=true protein_id=Seg11577.1/GoldUCD/D3Y31
MFTLIALDGGEQPPAVEQRTELTDEVVTQLQRLEAKIADELARGSQRKDPEPDPISVCSLDIPDK